MLPQIIKRLPVRTFYETVLGQILPPENKNGDVSIICPFHEKRLGHPDDTGSCSVSMLNETGGKYFCFGCRASGTLLTFYQHIHGHRTLTDAAHALVKEFDLDPESLTTALIPNDQVVKWCNEIFTTKEGKVAYEHLRKERCIPDSIIHEYRLGFEESSGRVTIPIYDADGLVVDVRHWLPKYARITDQLKRNKIYSLPGCGASKMYPYRALRHDQIVICAGELDALAMTGQGFTAITSTTGERIFPHSWASYFTNKDVIIFYDKDYAGSIGTDELIEKLYKEVRSLKAVVPDNWPDHVKDVTDFILHAGMKHARSELLALIEATPPIQFNDPEDDTYRHISLYQAFLPANINKKISLDGLVGGKDTANVYVVPTKIRCMCTETKAKPTCYNCPRKNGGGDTKIFEIDMLSNELLELCRKGNDPPVLKKILNISCGTVKFDWDDDDYATVEHVTLVPDVARTLKNVEFHEYFKREAYIVGYGIRMNQRYHLKGKIIMSSLSVGTMVFKEHRMLDNLSGNTKPDDIIECDGVSDTVHNHLSIFQPAPGQSLEAKLDEIYCEIEEYVTHIIKRRDVLMVTDLTYFGPLAFNFGDEPQYRGWISALIIGDSQCAKSETSIKLRDFYRFGEMFSGETITQAGIIGAYDSAKSGAQFFAGIAPRNDGQLIIIDEAGGLSDKQFGELTYIRSSGEALSTKWGQNNRFDARVRMLMLANPRAPLAQGGSPRSMNDYEFGVEAIQDLVGEAPDIARFDLFCSVRSEEVPYEEINQPLVRRVADMTYTSDKQHELINWAWTRAADQIDFTPEAQMLIREGATAQSNFYHADIPLVAPGSHRWTIARVAFAFAARTYSTPDGVRVTVTADHASMAIKFLAQTYDKPSMGYDAYSRKRKRLEVLVSPTKVKELLDVRSFIFTHALREHKTFTATQFQDATAASRYDLSLLADLRILGALYQIKSKWYISKGFELFLTTYKHPQEETYIDSLGEDEDVNDV